MTDKNNKKIALLGKELIIREEIRINDLYKLYPEVFIGITPTCYKVKDDYTIDGHNNIILKRKILDQFDKYHDHDCALAPYMCIRFVGQESSKNVWMRHSNEEDHGWMHNWFEFDSVYRYRRPNIMETPLDFDYDFLEFMIMRDAPIKKLEGYYKVDLRECADYNLIIVPIVNYDG